MTHILSRSDVHGFVAETDGRIVGSNFLWETAPIVGVGPHSGDPHYETTPASNAAITPGSFVLIPPEVIHTFANPGWDGIARIATTTSRTWVDLDNDRVVDCDLRNPSIQKLFELPLGPGVSEVLRQELDVSDAVLVAVVVTLAADPRAAGDARARRSGVSTPPDRPSPGSIARPPRPSPAADRRRGRSGRVSG